MPLEGKPPAPVVLIRPILKIAGGHIVVAHLKAGGQETEVARLPVGGEPDHNWPGLVERIDQELAAGNRRYVLDLDRVPWMNSRGLGRLIELWRRIDDRGGAMAVVCDNERIRNILTISQVDQILKPLPSLQAALRSVDRHAIDR